MSFLTTSSKMKYTFVLAIVIAFFNYASAQYCPPPTNNITVCYQLGGGIALDFQCSETNGTPTIALTVESITGGTAPYTVSTQSGSNGRVSETEVAEGGSIIYSFTLDDYQNNRVNFLIRDQVNRSTSLDADLLSQISNNLFSGNCSVVKPYFLVSDNKIIQAGENETFTATECILLAPTFEVQVNADFEAGIETAN